jgi:hypothetical protein
MYLSHNGVYIGVNLTTLTTPRGYSTSLFKPCRVVNLASAPILGLPFQSITLHSDLVIRHLDPLAVNGELEVQKEAPNWLTSLAGLVHPNPSQRNDVANLPTLAGGDARKPVVLVRRIARIVNGSDPKCSISGCSLRRDGSGSHDGAEDRNAGFLAASAIEDASSRDRKTPGTSGSTRASLSRVFR